MAGQNHLIGAAAVALGVPEHTLRKLTDSGVIDAPRVGRYRVFPADRMGDYRRALEQGGHVRPSLPDAGR